MSEPTSPLAAAHSNRPKRKATSARAKATSAPQGRLAPSLAPELKPVRFARAISASKNSRACLFFFFFSFSRWRAHRRPCAIRVTARRLQSFNAALVLHGNARRHVDQWRGGAVSRVPLPLTVRHALRHAGARVSRHSLRYASSTAPASKTLLPMPFFLCERLLSLFFLL